MFKYFKKRRDLRDAEIAKAVYDMLKARTGWERFLPPVAVRDSLYMVTENGSIYAMKFEHVTGMEQIIQIRRG